MTAVEILKQILECNDEDWKARAFNFSITQGDKTYTVAYLLAGEGPS
jgi:hypothetical protein